MNGSEVVAVWWRGVVVREGLSSAVVKRAVSVSMLAPVLRDSTRNRGGG